MTLYLDSSALLKRYVDEPDSDRFGELLSADPRWITARITWVEVRRNLSRLLGAEAARALAGFEQDWRHLSVVELDERTCDDAAAIAVELGVRSLDALHLAAARRVGSGAVVVVTADLRQAQAARSLGLIVVGA